MADSLDQDPQSLYTDELLWQHNESCGTLGTAGKPEEPRKPESGCKSPHWTETREEAGLDFLSFRGSFLQGNLTTTLESLAHVMLLLPQCPLAPIAATSNFYEKTAIEDPLSNTKDSGCATEPRVASGTFGAQHGFSTSIDTRKQQQSWGHMQHRLQSRETHMEYPRRELAGSAAEPSCGQSRRRNSQSTCTEDFLDFSPFLLAQHLTWMDSVSTEFQAGLHGPPSTKPLVSYIGLLPSRFTCFLPLNRPTTSFLDVPRTERWG